MTKKFAAVQGHEKCCQSGNWPKNYIKAEIDAEISAAAVCFLRVLLWLWKEGQFEAVTAAKMMTQLSYF